MTPEAMTERAKVVAYLKERSTGRIGLRDRLVWAWLALTKPQVTVNATKLALATRIEAGHHLTTIPDAQEETKNG